MSRPKKVQVIREDGYSVIKCSSLAEMMELKEQLMFGKAAKPKPRSGKKSKGRGKL